VRPHKLTISGFLSYGGEEVIDFDALSSAGGLFLIHGRTGAGKTSILDAISFAIYGVLPGSRKSVAKSYRSDFAKLETPTFVELEMSVKGKRLKIYRKPEYEAPKARGEGTTTRKSELKVLQEVNGDWAPLADTPAEANVEIARLMGMDSSQFFKLILLPQGDFAQFLRSSPKDRGVILEALFSDEVALFAKLMTHFKNQYDGANKVQEASKGAVADEQNSIETTFDTLYQDDDYDLDADIPATADAAKAYLELLEVEITAATARFEKAEKDKEKALKVSNEAEAKFNSSAKVLEAKKNLDSAKKALDDWREKNKESVALKVANDKVVSTINTAISALEKEITAAQESNSKFNDLIEERKNVTTLTAAQLKAANELSDLQESTKDSLAQINELKKATTSDANPEAEQEKIKGSVKELKDSLDKITKSDTVKAQIKALETEVKDLEKKEKAAEASYIEAQKTFDSEAASVLAAKLSDGAPCPVCGSHEHPHPATSHGTVTKEQVEKAQEALNKATKALSDKEGDLKVANEKLGDLGEAAGAKRSDIEKQIADFDKKLSGLINEAKDLKTKRDKLKVLEDKQKGDQDKLTTLTAKEATASEALKGANKTVVALLKALKIAEDAEIELIDIAKPTAEIARLKSIEAKYEPLLKALNTATDTVGALDDGSNEEIPDHIAAKQAHRDAENLSIEMKEAVERVKALQKQLVAIEKELRKAEKALAAASIDVEKYGKLSLHLNGQTGERVQLVQFYLGHRLQQILTYANQRLQEMTHGQFTLKPNPNRKGAGQNYLSISVFDAWNQGTRDASTLSGGETFTASLALAFGLADVVTNEAGGRSLESLFIDEGFGTLDPEYLEKVMQSLDELRESGRMIGLISHVEEMKQRIPMQLLVTKESGDGAHVQIIENAGL
jgi:DNA repair protein SbcC/Rad50